MYLYSDAQNKCATENRHRVSVFLTSGSLKLKQCFFFLPSPIQLQMYMCIRTARTAPVLFHIFNNSFLISSTSHFVKVSLHDFAALHVKFGLLCWKGMECGTINVLSRLSYFHNHWKPKSKRSILINRTALMHVFLYVKFTLLLIYRVQRINTR